MEMVNWIDVIGLVCMAGFSGGSMGAYLARAVLARGPWAVIYLRGPFHLQSMNMEKLCSRGAS